MEKLDAALLDLLKQNKSLYKILINKFTFTLSDQIPVAAVTWNKETRQFVVMLNRQLERELKVQQIKALLIHEISHVLMLHLFRIGSMNAQKFNIAADLIINEGSYDIKYELKPLFPNAVWIDTIKLKEPLPEDQKDWTVEAIYDLLEDDNQDNTNWDNHNELNELDAFEEIKELAQHMAETKHDSGTFTHITRLIQQKEREMATINKLLKTFSATFKIKSNNKSASWLRKSRKLPNLPIPGKVRKTPVPHILIGVDLSGSMLDCLPLIDRFLSSLDRINATFDLSLGDVEEKLFLSYNELKHCRIPKINNVGGGTDLSFVAERFNNTKSYDGIILFTDGLLTFPNLPDNKTIIALTENTQVPFSKIVKINKGDKYE